MGKVEWEVYEEKDKEKVGDDVDKLSDIWRFVSDNYGVLFDVDVIRVELVKE